MYNGPIVFRVTSKDDDPSKDARLVRLMSIARLLAEQASAQSTQAMRRFVDKDGSFVEVIFNAAGYSKPTLGVPADVMSPLSPNVIATISLAPVPKPRPKLPEHRPEEHLPVKVVLMWVPGLFLVNDEYILEPPTGLKLVYPVMAEPNSYVLAPLEKVSEKSGWVLYKKPAGFLPGVTTYTSSTCAPQDEVADGDTLYCLSTARLEDGTSVLLGYGGQVVADDINVPGDIETTVPVYQNNTVLWHLPFSDDYDYDPTSENDESGETASDYPPTKLAPDRTWTYVSPYPGYGYSVFNSGVCYKRSGTHYSFDGTATDYPGNVHNAPNWSMGWKTCMGRTTQDAFFISYHSGGEGDDSGAPDKEDELKIDGIMYNTDEKEGYGTISIHFFCQQLGLMWSSFGYDALHWDKGLNVIGPGDESRPWLFENSVFDDGPPLNQSPSTLDNCGLVHSQDFIYGVYDNAVYDLTGLFDQFVSVIALRAMASEQLPIIQDQYGDVISGTKILVTDSDQATFEQRYNPFNY